MLSSLLDDLKTVSEGIANVRAIVDAVRSGIDYVNRTHPEIRSDLTTLLEELSKSLGLIKRASAVLTNFRFALAADGNSQELARFNDYFIKSKDEAYQLETHIHDLRTHCSVVREHSARICGGTGATAFATLFALLGLRSADRERELGQHLDRLAYEDFAVANSAEIMLHCLTASLQDVQEALLDGATMQASRIPSAAALLADYGAAFEEREAEAHKAITIIRHCVEQLR